MCVCMWIDLMRSWYATGIAVVCMEEVDNPLYRAKPRVLDLRMLRVWYSQNVLGQRRFIVSERQPHGLVHDARMIPAMEGVFVFMEFEQHLNPTTHRISSRVGSLITLLEHSRELHRMHLAAQQSRAFPQHVLLSPALHDSKHDEADGAMGPDAMERALGTEVRRGVQRVRSLQQVASELVAREVELKNSRGFQLLSQMPLPEAKRVPALELDPGQTVDRFATAEPPVDILAFDAFLEEQIASQFGISRSLYSTSHGGTGAGASRSQVASHNTRILFNQAITALKGRLFPVLKCMYFNIYTREENLKEIKLAGIEIRLPGIPTAEETTDLYRQGWLKPEAARHHLASAFMINPEQINEKPVIPEEVMRLAQPDAETNPLRRTQMALTTKKRRLEEKQE